MKIKKAEVIKTGLGTTCSKMEIKILSHDIKNEIGTSFYVQNTSSKFNYIPKSQELHITTDGYKT